MMIEIELDEIEPEIPREYEKNLIIRNYGESIAYVSLEIVTAKTGQDGYITVNLAELKKVLDKIAL